MPALSAPELRRKKSERTEEFKRLNAEYTKDGAAPTDEQLVQLNSIFEEIENNGTFDRQIKAAEMFAMAEGIEARGKESAGRKTDPLPPEDPANTRGERHQYSYLKAIREAAGWGDDWAADASVAVNPSSTAAPATAIVGSLQRMLIPPRGR